MAIFHSASRALQDRSGGRALAGHLAKARRRADLAVGLSFTAFDPGA